MLVLDVIKLRSHHHGCSPEIIIFRNDDNDDDRSKDENRGADDGADEKRYQCGGGQHETRVREYKVTSANSE